MNDSFERLVPVALILALCRPAAAQTWVATTDDYIADEVGRVIQTRDGRFLAVANTGRALALIKRNSDGSLLWQRLLMGSPTGEAGFDVAELPDGRIVAAGDIHDNDHGNDDMALVIVSADARTVHLRKTFGGAGGDDRALGLVPVRSGGYLLVGLTQSWGSPGQRMLAVRVGAGGELEWAKVFRSAGSEDVLYTGVELPTGEFLVAGGSGSVLKLDRDGSLVWSRNYGLQQIRQIASASDGNLVIAGWRLAGADEAAELIKIDASGAILWRSSYGRPGGNYRFLGVAALDDGGFFAGGEINGPGFTDFHGWAVRLDAAGNIVWQRHLDDIGGEVHSVARTGDGSLLVGGHRESFPRMMMARIDATGQASGCDHPMTLATRTASSESWTAASFVVIEPTTLVVRDANEPMEDAVFPQDQSWCQGGPMYPPSEVSPPAAWASPLIFQDESTLAWEDGAPSASTRFNLYRGDLADLRSGGGPACLISGLTAATASDSDIPAPGASFIYLVGGENQAGAGTLGRASDGSERQPAVTCN